MILETPNKEISESSQNSGLSKPKNSQKKTLFHIESIHSLPDSNLIQKTNTITFNQINKIDFPNINQIEFKPKFSIINTKLPQTTAHSATLLHFLQIFSHLLVRDSRIMRKFAHYSNN